MHIINYLLDSFVNKPPNSETNKNQNNKMEKTYSYSSLAYDSISKTQDVTEKVFELITINLKINNSK